MHLKAVILLGGPQKGTRFRPLSLDLPKPLFPIAGFPMVQHHIEACSRIPEVSEIFLVGFYQPNDSLTRFIRRQKQAVDKPVSYLQEYTMLGTAGCLHHFRDVITNGAPDGIIVMYSDVFCDFPLREMLAFKKDFMKCLILSVEVPAEQSQNFGCIGINHDTGEVVHYVDKPETFVSRDINGGVYVISTDALRDIGKIMLKRSNSTSFFDSEDGMKNETNGTTNYQHYNSCSNYGKLFFEIDIFPKLYAQGKLYAYQTEKFWMSIKSAGSALYANRAILESYKKYHPERLNTSSTCIGNVFIDATANVDPSAVIGPNVSIGAGVVVGKGVRIKNSIILEGTILKNHCCILHGIVGWHSVVGDWARVEGTPTELNPNAPHATTDNFYLFENDGRLRPSITILGQDVVIPPEVIIRNSIVMPNKILSRGFKNQILL